MTSHENRRTVYVVAVRIDGCNTELKVSRRNELQLTAPAITCSICFNGATIRNGANRAGSQAQRWPTASLAQQPPQSCVNNARVGPGS